MKFGLFLLGIKLIVVLLSKSVKNKKTASLIKHYRSMHGKMLAYFFY